MNAEALRSGGSFDEWDRKEGTPGPMGVTWVPSLNAWNFALYSRRATGVSLLTTAPESKRLGLLHELMPGARIVGAMIDPNYQEAEAQARELRDAATTLGQRIQIAYAGSDKELESAFETLVRERADAVLVAAAPFFDSTRWRPVS